MLINRNKNSQLLLQRTRGNGRIAILGANCSAYRINMMINSTNGTCFNLDQSWSTHLRHRKTEVMLVSKQRVTRHKLITDVNSGFSDVPLYTIIYMAPTLLFTQIHELSATTSSWLVLALDGIYTCSFPRRNAQSVFSFPSTVWSRCKQASRLPSL